MLRSPKGVSLFEVLIVVLLTGLGMALFSTVFVNNWFAYENRIVHANLMNEANTVLDTMTAEGRLSRQIDLGGSASQRTATFYSGLDGSTSVLTLFNDGRVTFAKSGATKTLTTHLDLANSSLTSNARSLQVRLALTDIAGTRPVRVSGETEVLPRN